MRFLVFNKLALVLFCMCASSHGSDVLQVEVPGFGFFGDEDGSWLEVQQTDDGSRLELFLRAGGPDTPDFSVTWPAEEWTKMRFDEITIVGRPSATILFDAFEVAGGLGGLVTGREVYLQPKERDYHLLVFTDFGLCFEPDGQGGNTNTCSGSLILEYSIQAVEPPIPGDLNYDDRVDFADFVTLSSRFDPRWQGTPPHWRDGDFNLDRRISFSDFQILADNYGNVRETPPAAAPEPKSVMLPGLALLGLGRLLRRARSS